MHVKEIQTNSCMTKSKLTDYVINPYTGCEHGCKYCYAVFMKRFQHIDEEWGDFIHVKINCVDFLEKELASYKSGTIFMSSVTDPYTPIESKYKLTRKILETIAHSKNKHKFHLEILTKSALIRRDFDLLATLRAEIGLSINTLDVNAARLIEPLAVSPKIRIQLLKEAKERGMKVYGFISPVIPGITNLDELFRELSFCDYVWVELLNTKPAAVERLLPVLKKEFPQYKEQYHFMSEHFDEYCKNISAEVAQLEKKYKLKVREVVVHNH